MKHFHLAQLYPNLMNLYGDIGNIICLQKRLEWYGYGSKIKTIGSGEKIDFRHIDLLFMGGGSERGQEQALLDLRKAADPLLEAIEGGLPVLFICGAYQLLGAYYHSPAGRKLPCLGLFPFHTRGFRERFTGDILMQINLEGKQEEVIGFENHGGRTYFQDNSLSPFGKVIKGFGNNGEDGMEGIRYKNLFGTYLHGPLLPKNPKVADFLIKAMSERKGIAIDRILDDSLEDRARRQVKRKLMG